MVKFLWYQHFVSKRLVIFMSTLAILAVWLANAQNSLLTTEQKLYGQLINSL